MPSSGMLARKFLGSFCVSTPAYRPAHLLPSTGVRSITLIQPVGALQIGRLKQSWMR
jgi:hypothetical protein